ncbi:hypothetical protein Q7P37_009392 [Cladosporium fusiforme]
MGDRDSAKDLRAAGWDWKKTEEREKTADVLTGKDGGGLTRKLSNALPRRQNSTRKSQSGDDLTTIPRSSNSIIRRNASTRKSQSGILQPIPVGSNPRVLCLDGGGVRGIVQLEVLRGLERALGDRIAVQAFFDLIVGSGFGGLLAVSLGMKGQTVESCAEQFKSTCDRAFKPKIAGVPGMKSITAALSNGQMYRSKQLYDALKVAFGEKDCLLGSPASFNTTNRIAMLSAHGKDQETFLMSNYRQTKSKPGNQPTDSLVDLTTQDKELKIWESVAAATADPAYYPPFECNGKTYVDGGLKCGNPASIAEQERKQLWPDVEEPDLFLSLGTGQNRIAVLKETSKNGSSGDDEPVRPARRASRRWSMRRDEEILDAEFAWTKFKEKLERDKTEAKSNRYIRLNPDLGKTPPAPDSRHEMDSVQNNVRKWLQRPNIAKAMRNIAHRLVASSFYLDSRSTVTDEQGEQVFSGTIACRFKYGSDQLRALGRILQDRMSDGFEPYFLVKPDASSKYQSSTVKLTKDIVRVIAERGIFALPGISIPINDASKASTLNLFLEPKDALEPDGFPISGFPHVLLEKQTQTNKRPSTRPRALSEQRFPSFSHSRATSLSRANSTTAVPSARKRATYSPSSTGTTAQRSSSFRASGSKRLSIQEIIAEEQSGAFVERRTSQFWSYIGHNQISEHPERFAAESTPSSSTATYNVRPESLLLDIDPFSDSHAYEDVMWSPLDGGKNFAPAKFSGDVD